MCIQVISNTSYVFFGSKMSINEPKIIHKFFLVGALRDGKNFHK